ncbi:MAG TPA: mucoidy inhibitor MuiA family protein [Geobacteraceae bacterium]
MTNLRTILLLAILALPGTLFGAEVQRVSAAPRITAVTVYPDRAMTTRSAAVNLKPGSYLIAFERLPVLIEDDSVRVEARGSAAATLAGLEVKRVFVEQSGEKRVKELDDEIRELERQVGAQDAKTAGIAAQKAFIESIRVAWGDRLSKELAIGRPTSAELTEASAFVATGVTKAEEQTRDLEFRKTELRAKIDALRRERDQSQGSRRKEVKTVEVAVEVARGGDLTVELSAVSPRAMWEPAYDVRLAPDAKTAELVFRALVRQQTGEDWTGVNLSLSTARPAVGGAPAELSPWHISFYRPQPPMPAAAPLGMYRGAKMERLAKSTDQLAEARAEEPEEAAAAVLTAAVSEEQTSVLFTIPRPVDVPTDGAQHGSVVALETLPVTAEYLTVPKLSPLVYLKSEIVNRATYPLLPGKVNIFAGGNFTGSAQLKKVAAGERFDLFFGADDRLTVKREEIKRHKEGGIFGKSRMAYRFRIELQNFRKEAQTVTVKDQLPLAGDEEIKVTLDEPSVKPDEVKDDGTLSWKLSLSPGEKRELSFGIVVEYPKDREITGL